MRVLLIIPTHRYGHQWPAPVGITDLPIGFAYLSSSLKIRGFEVRPVNLNNHPEYSTPDKMIRHQLVIATSAFDPDVVCTGGISADYACLKQIVKVSRECVPNARIVLGGGAVTHDREFICKSLAPDDMIVGEADEKLPALLSGTVAPAYPDVESLPLPDYTVFGDWRAHATTTRWLYSFPQRDPKPIVLVAARSCPFRCTFCVHEGAPPYRARSVSSLIRELQVMRERYPYNIVVILDELFAVKKDRVREFSQAVLDAGLRFSWCFQTHSSAKLDPDTLRLAKRAGCYLFSYGLESAAPAVLASMNKRSTPSRIADGIKAAQAADVLFSGNFIFGDPAETWRTVWQSFVFYWKHCRKCFITFAGVRPYPGSRLFEVCQERGLIADRASYYATIDRRHYNMTGMWSWTWLGFIRAMDARTRFRVWAFIRAHTPHHAITLDTTAAG